MMTDYELRTLQKYRLQPGLEKKFCVEDLLMEENLKGHMKGFAVAIGAPSEKIASSIIMKRYAFVAVFFLYAMTVWDKKINVSLDNVEMEIIDQDILPMFSLRDSTSQKWSGLKREDWREEVIHDLFAKNISLLIVMLEKLFDISRFILWENIAVYIFWLYETELSHVSNQKVENDFRFLINEEEGELFGCYSENPLHQFYTEEFFKKERSRMRKSCCFSYQLEAKLSYCKTCPRRH